MKKSWFGCFLAMLVLLACCAPAAGATQITEEPLILWGWSTLSPEQKYVYECLEEGVAVLSEDISVDESKKITEQDLAAVSRAFCSDHPEYFWYL